jgi:hypothetical protein
MSNEVLIGIGGLIISVLAYFAGVSRTKKQLKERQRRREQLATILTEAQQLRTRLNEDRLLVGEHNAWIDRVCEYLRNNLGKAYEVRFNDFSGMSFYGDGSERSKMSNSIEGRSRRLTEFMSELDR